MHTEHFINACLGYCWVIIKNLEMFWEIELDQIHSAINIAVGTNLLT